MCRLLSVRHLSFGGGVQSDSDLSWCEQILKLGHQPTTMLDMKGVAAPRQAQMLHRKKQSRRVFTRKPPKQATRFGGKWEMLKVQWILSVGETNHHHTHVGKSWESPGASAQTDRRSQDVPHSLEEKDLKPYLDSEIVRVERKLDHHISPTSSS